LITRCRLCKFVMPNKLPHKDNKKVPKINTPTVRFNLKSSKPKSEPTSIRAVFRYGDPTKRLVYSSRLKIKPSQWDKKKQAPRTTAREYRSVMDKLNTMRKAIEDTHREHGDIPVKEFRHILDLKLRRTAPSTSNKIEKQYGEFIAWSEKWIDSKEETEDISFRTIQKFRTTIRKLKDFIDDKKERINPLSFEDVNWEFQKKYKRWLIGKKDNNANTISKEFKAIKQLLKGSYKEGKHNSNVMPMIKDFGFAEVDTKNKIEWTFSELEKIKTHNYPEEHLRRIADLTIIGSYTGLRISDWDKVNKNNITEINGKLFLDIVAYKTKQRLKFPVLPEILEILEKYDYKLPKVTQQHYNRTIKEVCRLAIPDSTFHRIHAKGMRTDSGRCPKWEYATSHACRRSFATNFFNLGYSPSLLRQITGHTTDQAFLNYVNADINKFSVEAGMEFLERWDNDRDKIKNQSI